jgi:DNA-repair protein XRCC1
MESRSGSNPNRVRMFTTDTLSKREAEQKWDRVKVVCTQPFNKHVQYGLAFITFHSLIAEDKRAALSSKLGRFVVKDDGDDSLSAGSLFARRKDIETQPLKGKALQPGYLSQTGPGVYYVIQLNLHSVALKDI